MQEVFEKIIGDLELKCVELENVSNFKLSQNQKSINYGYCCAINHAIEIVNQVAVEYNNGWIPVEERLPEKPNEFKEEKAYLVTVVRNDGYTFWDRLIFHDYGWNIPGGCKVTAWMEPEPYQPKGE